MPCNIRSDFITLNVTQSIKLIVFNWVVYVVKDQKKTFQIEAKTSLKLNIQRLHLFKRL